VDSPRRLRLLRVYPAAGRVQRPPSAPYRPGPCPRAGDEGALLVATGWLFERPDDTSEKRLGKLPRPERQPTITPPGLESL